MSLELIFCLAQRFSQKVALFFQSVDLPLVCSLSFSQLIDGMLAFGHVLSQVMELEPNRIILLVKVLELSLELYQEFVQVVFTVLGLCCGLLQLSKSKLVVGFHLSVLAERICGFGIGGILGDL